METEPESTSGTVLRHHARGRKPFFIRAAWRTEEGTGSPRPGAVSHLYPCIKVQPGKPRGFTQPAKARGEVKVPQEP